MKLPNVKTDFYPLEGGLDLVTPPIAIPPGCVIESQNYEPDIAGKYRRIDGFERTDGTPLASVEPYYILNANVTGSLAVGNTIVGATSAATGVVLAIFTGYIVLSRVTGTFINTENLKVGTVNQAQSLGSQTAYGAYSSSDDADYKLLASNDRRSFINAVPGSGSIRGVWIFNDILYAFRDSLDGLTNNMYKATTSGWVQIVFNSEVLFTNAVSQINIGDVVTGATSGATGTVLVALLTTGTWTTNGVGSLVIGSTTGTFISGEAIKVATITKVTTSTGSGLIKRQPGGKMEFFNYNFSGSTLTTKMYGVCGKNTAFEFDGATYVPVHTGMIIDTPSHIIAHKGFLFLSFLASVQYSALGNPYAWTVVLGAGEIDCSNVVTGFLPQGGNQAGSSLAIFTQVRTFVLYGSSNLDFKLVSSVFDIGYSSFTAQQVSNNAYGLTSRGIQTLLTTLNYGDFDYASISHMIQPLMTQKRGLEIASNTIRIKNQYRIYFSDGTAIVVGLTGDKTTGLMLLNYSMPVRCICSSTLTSGVEVTYFGSDSGYVYKDQSGTSQDGNAIEAYLRLPFNNDKSPRIRKRFIRAVFEVTVDAYCQINASSILGYGTTDVLNSNQPTKLLSRTSVNWDNFVWDTFYWDGAGTITDPSISIDGTEKNISIYFYSLRAQDSSHTISGITLLSIPRRLER